MNRLTANRIRNIQAAAQVDPMVRREIAGQTLASQQSDNKEWIYSRVFISPTSSPPSTFEAGNAYFFGYAIGQDIESTGAQTRRATIADTNLIKQRQTPGGKRLHILSMTLDFDEETDPYVLAQLLPYLTVNLRMDNAVLKHLGKPSHIPGGSHLGAGMTDYIEPPLDSSGPVLWKPTQNGLVGQEDKLLFAQDPSSPHAVIWEPEKTDSQLDIELVLTNGVTPSCKGQTRAAVSAAFYSEGTPVPMVQPWDDCTDKILPPIGVYVMLEAVAIGERSSNR